MKKLLPFLLSFLCLAASVIYVTGKQPPRSSVKERSTYDSKEKDDREMRGVWVTYMTLDVENEADPENAFKDRIDRVITDMEKVGLNTMIVQVRPFSDALYRSRYYPWSHILTGTQGKDPGYDPLTYIVEQAHAHQIGVHAWVNPYRVSTQNIPSALSADNPYVRDSSIGFELNGCVYLDPGSEKARELILSGVMELAEGYDVDGIQFDDYFYPPDCGDFDKEAYDAYAAQTASPLSLEGFRRENVSTLIRETYDAVHQADPDIRFGVSPQGNLNNNDSLYADVKKWCTEEGYLDYICPQIYFSLDNPALTFEDGLADWLALEIPDTIDLYVGIPAYKAGTDADSGTWLDNDDILKTEIGICREKGVGGFMLYSYDSLNSEVSSAEIQNVIRYLNSPTADKASPAQASVPTQ